MKKQNLINWIIEQQNQGNSVPVVINGGGFSYISPDDDFTISDDYSDDIEFLAKGEEFEDFKSCLSAEEYDGMTFVTIRHQNGFNQENMDIQVGVWDVSGITD